MFRFHRLHQLQVHDKVPEMISLSQADTEKLQIDSNSLTMSILVGVLVGSGSMVLHFSNGSSVLVQCSFETYSDETSHSGHGESPGTSGILFEYLNKDVVAVKVDTTGEMTFDFGASGRIRITPDGSGLESYVLRTAQGVFPVY